VSERRVVAGRCVVLLVLIGAFIGPVFVRRPGSVPTPYQDRWSLAEAVQLLAMETTVAILAASVLELWVRSRGPLAAVGVAALVWIGALAAVGVAVVVSAYLAALTTDRSFIEALELTEWEVGQMAGRPLGEIMSFLACLAVVAAPAAGLTYGRLRAQPLSSQVGTSGLVWLLTWEFAILTLPRDLSALAVLSLGRYDFGVLRRNDFGVLWVLLGLMCLGAPALVSGIDAVFERALRDQDAP
jgi:hypothetical protein